MESPLSTWTISTVNRLLSVARCSRRFLHPARSSNTEMTEQVIVDRASARRQKSSARESLLAMSMRTSVSTKALGSVATTRQPLPQRPCIGSPIADVRPPCPHSTERGFEKALSRLAFQSHLVLVRDGRFSKRPNNIPHDPQSGLRDSLQRFNNLMYRGFFTPCLRRFHNFPLQSVGSADF